MPDLPIIKEGDNAGARRRFLGKDTPGFSPNKVQTNPDGASWDGTSALPPFVRNIPTVRDTPS